LGTFVKVTNLRNGRTVVVRVNDRGPVVDGRIIDLSYGAARVLNLEHRGIQQVRLDLVSPPQTVAVLRPVARLQ
jgi:rare lipoprotein A